jgi:hypothetical protein
MDRKEAVSGLMLSILMLDHSVEHCMDYLLRIMTAVSEKVL